MWDAADTDQVAGIHRLGLATGSAGVADEVVQNTVGVAIKGTTAYAKHVVVCDATSCVEFQVSSISPTRHTCKHEIGILHVCASGHLDRAVTVK